LPGETVVNRDFDYVLRSSGAQRIWLDRRLAETDLVSVLRNPDALLQQPGCEIIKDQRKVKIGRVSVMLDGREAIIYVKRYNVFSWGYRIRSLFLRSESMAALNGAAVLGRAKIAAVRPLAAVESRRCGSLEESFFVSEEIEGAATIDAYWKNQLAHIAGHEGYRHRRNFLSALARLLGGLHRQRIYHNDLKDANILVSAAQPGDEKFFLLDLEGVRRCWYVSRRRRVKNLVQLNRTLGQLLSRADKLFFLRAYLQGPLVDAGMRRRWVRRTVSATERADQRSFDKHARRTAGSVI
jgi:hypothetical protein